MATVAVTRSSTSLQHTAQLFAVSLHALHNGLRVWVIFQLPLTLNWYYIFFFGFSFFSCGLLGLCHRSTSTLLLSSAFLLQFSTRQLRHKSRYVLCLYKFSLAIWPSQWLETWLSKIIGCLVTVFWSVFFSVLVEVWSACYGAVWLNRCRFGLFLFVVLFLYLFQSLLTACQWFVVPGL